ncbi:hypothetical protein PR202_ga30420 [Eleusine coracana subsp. coracana]|uniref:Reverse transcriptase zinc-binding domain-containing protein n=1 Tax=Eleusine coracana subsp. coracana TaxID=191504 RepID=A0AAV5DPQ3_ELECO|nr:hypothetical protein PR202_ga30420 [Eleusine coracana subsp. coracana]
MWLITYNRCWTADWLARRNLPRSKRCLLCDQEKQSIHHVLTSCVFACQFWCLQRVGLIALSPQLHTWWSRAADSMSSTTRKGLNSIIILSAWTLWKHRNACVFNGASPNLAAALVMAGEETRFWNMAGAKGLSLLTGHGPMEGD